MREYKGFKRACKTCSHIFKPTSKSNKLCPKCKDKKFIEAMDKRWGKGNWTPKRGYLYKNRGPVNL